MKKLMSVLAVAAIVTSAFAFTSNKFSSKFCAATTQNGTCQFLINKKIVTTGGTQFFYDSRITPANANDCINAVCDTQVKLAID